MSDDPEPPAARDSRPLRDMLLQLPLLPVSANQDVDYDAADPALLVQLGDNADRTMRTIHQGIAALGRLLVYVSPEVGTGEFPADAMEALGWLLAELGDLAATAHAIGTSCQRFTSDYSPATTKDVPNARP